MSIKKKLKYFTRPKQISPDLSGVSGDFRIVCNKKCHSTSNTADQTGKFLRVISLSSHLNICGHSQFPMLKVPNVPQGINIDVWQLFPDHYQVVQTITGPLPFPPIVVLYNRKIFIID